MVSVHVASNLCSEKVKTVFFSKEKDTRDVIGEICAGCSISCSPNRFLKKIMIFMREGFSDHPVGWKSTGI